MLRQLFQRLTLAAFSFLFLPAYANDSTARVGVGGIVLLKENNIRMLQEVLEISTKAIRVQYRFLNESTKEISATVAFPMPPFLITSSEWRHEDRNGGPVTTFRLKVDGTDQPVRRMERAVVGNRDVTEALRKLGLFEWQIFEVRDQMVGSDYVEVTKAQRKRMEQMGIADWKVEQTALWEQIFPPGRALLVEHFYKPFVGRIYTQPCQQGHGCIGDIREVLMGAGDTDPKVACIDDGAREAIAKKIQSLMKNGASAVAVILEDVEYVLGTGRNWKGPIADFKLKIVKEKPDQIVSLCFPGKPTRSGAFQFEFSQTNFVPQDKLVVYFYTIVGD